MSSKPSIRHYGKVRNGKLSFYNEELWEQQRWALEGQEVELQIKKRHRQITNDQYAYYYGGILTTCFSSNLFSHFDKSADISIYFENKFLSRDVMVIVGDKKEVVRKITSLSSLNKSEMAEFVEKSVIHCRTDLNINILSPEDYYLSQYKTKEI